MSTRDPFSALLRDVRVDDIEGPQTQPSRKRFHEVVVDVGPAQVQRSERLKAVDEGCDIFVFRLCESECERLELGWQPETVGVGCRDLEAFDPRRKTAR